MTKTASKRPPLGGHTRLAQTYGYFVMASILGPLFLGALLFVFHAGTLAVGDFERSHYGFLKKLGVGYSVIAIGVYIAYEAAEQFIWFLVLMGAWTLLIVLGGLGYYRFKRGQPPPF